MKYTLFDRLGCLYDLADDLHTLGLEVEYPRVVLIGEQDTGKSRLLEFLAGLESYKRQLVSKAYLERPGCVGTCAMLDDPVTGVPIIHVPYDLVAVEHFIAPANSVIVLLIRAEMEPPRQLFELVAQVDPGCKRTLGVLSHIDLVSAKTCTKILLYNELQVPFKLVGFTTRPWCNHSHEESLLFGFVGIEAVINHIGPMVGRLFLSGGRKPEPKRMRSGSL